MRAKTYISPMRYVQGPGALAALSERLPSIGMRPAVIGSRRRLDSFAASLEDLATSSGATIKRLAFEGECSDAEIARLQAAAAEHQADVVVAIGGGKSIDTGKAVAHRLDLDVVVIPTIAATDAPTAAAAIVYTPDGVFLRAEIYPRSPALILVDTDVIRVAPPRFLVSGMGDALATWFEADACRRSGASTVAGGPPTEAALAIARRCYDVLQSDARAALDGEARDDPAFERVVEANILLSGIGFESGGLAAAHSIHNGLTGARSTHRLYHGEKVAFATVCQLLIEGRDDEAADVAAFCRSVGLPTTLSDLGIDPADASTVTTVADAACAPHESIWNMPDPVSPEDVVRALQATETLS